MHSKKQNSKISLKKVQPLVSDQSFEGGTGSSINDSRSGSDQKQKGNKNNKHTKLSQFVGSQAIDQSSGSSESKHAQDMKESKESKDSRGKQIRKAMIKNGMGKFKEDISSKDKTTKSRESDKQVNISTR